MESLEDIILGKTNLNLDIAKIIKRYADANTDYDYFVQYGDYTNAIIIKLKEGDFKTVSSLIKYYSENKDINWGKILGYVLETEYKDVKNILKIIEKTTNLNFLIASLIRNKKVDCVKALLKYISKEDINLELLGEALGYIFYTEEYSEILNILKDIFGSIRDTEYYKGLFRGISKIKKWTNNKDTKTRLQKLISKIEEHGDIPLSRYGEDDFANIDEYVARINNNVLDNIDIAPIEEIEFAQYGYEDTYEDIIEKIMEGREVVEDEDDGDEGGMKTRLYYGAIIGAVMANRYELVQRLLNDLDTINITGIELLNGDFFYEQRARIPMLFLNFLLNLPSDDDDRNKLDGINQMKDQAEKYHNIFLLKYMKELGL